MLVEPAARQPGVVHDLVDRDLCEAVPVEQAAGAQNDAGAGLGLVLGGVGHGAVLEMGSAATLSETQKMFLNIF